MTPTAALAAARAVHAFADTVTRLLDGPPESAVAGSGMKSLAPRAAEPSTTRTAGRSSPLGARCPSCDHTVAMHQPDGCWHTVTTGTINTSLGCPCTMPTTRLTEETA